MDVVFVYFGHVIRTTPLDDSRRLQNAWNLGAALMVEFIISMACASISQSFACQASYSVYNNGSYSMGIRGIWKGIFIDRISLVFSCSFPTR